MKKEPELKQKLEEIREVIEDLVRSTVKKPEDVMVKEGVVGNLVGLAIRVDQPDVRLLVGKAGKHIKALGLLAREAAKLIGHEYHLSIDEKPIGQPRPAQDAFVLPKPNAKRLRDAKDLLRRTACLFVENPKTVTVEEKVLPMGSMVIYEIKIKKDDYLRVYGSDMNFEYGVDGSIIGSIKNFFDGIGKANGKTFRIGITQY